MQHKMIVACHDTCISRFLFRNVLGEWLGNSRLGPAPNLYISENRTQTRDESYCVMVFAQMISHKHNTLIQIVEYDHGQNMFDCNIFLFDV